jgi:DNA-binding transcriptional regulator GbsR (MarR family)
MGLIAEGRKQREIDPMLATLARCRDEAMTDGSDPAVAKRIAAMHEFVTSMTGWYDQVKRIPRPVLRKLMAMGAKVARFVS